MMERLKQQYPYLSSLFYWQLPVKEHPRQTAFMLYIANPLVVCCTCVFKETFSLAPTLAVIGLLREGKIS